MATDEILTWLNERYNQAQELYNEAEANRNSVFANIDTIEQSAYNEGVMEVLAELKLRLTEPKTNNASTN